MSVRWGAGPHPERRAQARVSENPVTTRDLVLALVAAPFVLAGLWAFCALLFTVIP